MQNIKVQGTNIKIHLRPKRLPDLFLAAKMAIESTRFDFFLSFAHPYLHSQSAGHCSVIV